MASPHLFQNVTNATPHQNLRSSHTPRLPKQIVSIPTYLDIVIIITLLSALPLCHNHPQQAFIALLPHLYLLAQMQSRILQQESRNASSDGRSKGRPTLITLLFLVVEKPQGCIGYAYLMDLL